MYFFTIFYILQFGFNGNKMNLKLAVKQTANLLMFVYIYNIFFIYCVWSLVGNEIVYASFLH